MKWLAEAFGKRSRSAIEPGLLHFIREADGSTVRFHLRVDPGGEGLLVANAAALARLTPSGVVIARGLLRDDGLADIVAEVKRRFRGATTTNVANDIEAVKTLIARMQSPAGNYPMLNLADPAFSPKVMPLGRPISADVPLCAPFHASRILDRLWQLGIPHVTFIAGRDCNEAHLIRAVQRASDLGLVTGVRARGSDLTAGKRIADMAAAGLDHLDVYCFSADERLHDQLAGKGDAKQAVRALGMAAKCEICPVAQVAIVRSTLSTVEHTFETLAEYDVQNVAVFAMATTEPEQASDGPLLARELPPLARQVEESAERLGLRLIWYPTMRFDPALPLGEQLCRGPRCAGDTSLRVEPDGTVILPRGPRLPAGNLLEDTWETIEESEVYRRYRTRIESDTHCNDCPGLEICASDCPREPQGWADAGAANE